MRYFFISLLVVVSLFLHSCSSNNPQNADNAATDGSDTTGGEGNSDGNDETDTGNTDEDSGNICGSDHPMVGRSAEFVTLFHDVAGSVTIVDNCTIQISNFTYDGGGPDVAFYAYRDGNYFDSDAFRIGPMLQGRTYTNESILLELPGGKTLDNFDSISVWCFLVGVSFGEAYLSQ